MDTGCSDYTRCAALLAGEAEILGKIASLQEAVRAAVMNRDWTDFEDLSGVLQEYGEGFERLEAERRRLSEGGPLDQRPAAPGGFYALIARLPEGQREELGAAYRALRLQALRVRLGNEALLEYLNGARSAVAAFLEAAFPERGGRIYSPRGVQAPPDMRSMVINRHF